MIDPAFTAEKARQVDELVREVAGLKQQKNRAYTERNMLVCAFAVLCETAAGYPVYRAEHPADDVDWEPDWRAILVIVTPHGQLSWHFHDDERGMLDRFPFNEEYVWDGHTTDEKYLRLFHMLSTVRRAK